MTTRRISVDKSLLSGVEYVALGHGVTLRVLVIYSFSRLKGLDDIKCAIDAISMMDPNVLSLRSDIALTGKPLNEDDYKAIVVGMGEMIKVLRSRSMR